MTAIDDTAVVKRWRRRLEFRKKLLAAAKSDLDDAKTGAERAEAKARVTLRKEQVEFAERVLDRREKPKLTVRERAVRAAMLGVKHRDKIIYTQGPTRWSGIQQGKRAHKDQYPTAADCSSFVTWCLWDALGGPKAGADRVNGASWTAGFTGTQCSHGKVVSRQKMQPGDLVMYPGSNGQIGHVAIYVGDGKVVSHGSNPGPQVLRADYRAIGHIRSYLP
jgi:cell wall-associated NlpC family hydrolase